MAWSFPDALGAEALAFLRADPVVHTVVLGALAQDPVPHSTWAELHDDEGRVRGVAWRTPPYGLGMTELSLSAAAELGRLIAAAAARGRPGLVDVSAVVGPRDTAAVVAEVLAAGTGATVAPGLVETLYRVDRPGDLVPDCRLRPAGRPRRAGDCDVALLASWLVAFAHEAGPIVPAPDPPRRIREALASGSLHVWDDGSVRCMVAGRHTGQGVARIGPVYTPPPDRGHGYATALTEVAARSLFAAGARVVTLYADDANATSTGIYRRLGFRGVLAWQDLRLVR